MLSLKVDVIDDQSVDEWAHFLASEPPAFELELDTQTGISAEEIRTLRFRNCVNAKLEMRSGTARPKGPNTTHYYLKTIAEPGASPDGGPAQLSGDSGHIGGPPLVS